MTRPNTTATRIDVWLWAVRIFKTRSLSSEAVRAGHAKLNGKAVKPSAQVVPGDRLKVWKDHRYLELEVTQTLQKRAGAKIATTCYVDHSPPPVASEVYGALPVRDRGAGRPTKKERRQLDRLRGRNSF